MESLIAAKGSPPKKETTRIIQERRMSVNHATGRAIKSAAKPTKPVINPVNIDHGTTGSTKIFVTKEMREISPIE